MIIAFQCIIIVTFALAFVHRHTVLKTASYSCSCSSICSLFSYR